MSKMIKTTIAAIAASSVVMSGMAVSTTASARTPQMAYQCEVTKSNSAKTGAVIGVVAGGLLGSQISKNEKGLGTVAGAVIGGLFGNKLGKDQGKDTCNKAEAAARNQAYDNRHYGYGAEPVRYDRYSSNRYQSGRNDNRYSSRY
ncbi:MAG: glycine zipper 2TM domain-containing protein [Asticcacaulis sp.]